MTRGSARSIRSARASLRRSEPRHAQRLPPELRADVEREPPGRAVIPAHRRRVVLALGPPQPQPARSAPAARPGPPGAAASTNRRVPPSRRPARADAEPWPAAPCRRHRWPTGRAGRRPSRRAAYRRGQAPALSSRARISWSSGSYLACGDAGACHQGFSGPQSPVGCAAAGPGR